jgi:predicted PurR-regulated permease PerM
MQTQNRFLDQLPVLLALGILLGGCALIVMPFGATLMWAAILTFITRHIYWWLNTKLGNRPWLASIIMVSAIILLVIVPAIYGLVKLSVIVNSYSAVLKNYLDQGTWPLPESISHLPYVGETISSWWDKLINGDSDVKQQFTDALKWVAALLLTLAKMAGQGFGLLLLSCIFSLFFYVSIDNTSAWLHGVMKRLSPEKGTEIIDIVGKNIQAVVLGIAGTAVAQGFLCGIAYVIAGVPNALTLGLASIILCLLPFGHALLWIPIAFGLYHQGHTGWAIFLVAWGAVVVGTADNFIKPLLIGQGSKLPMLLIVIGMIGGALNFGVLGIFIGPTLLAVAYTLLREWALNN